MKVLLRARAIENQCYVVAAAQVGQHHKKRASYGHAMVKYFSDRINSHGVKRSFILFFVLKLTLLGDM